MTTIKGIIHTEHYATHLYSTTNEIIADEPMTSGGKDKGFSPTELLAASLTACTSITLRMYADRKEWDLEKVEVNVNIEKNATENSTNIYREIKLFGNLTEEQKKRLLEIANQCPIHKTLTNPINIKTSLE
jgi:putative redox protein